MSDRSLSLTGAAVIALAALGAGSALAAEPAAVHAVKTVGAMTLETQGRATDGTMVRRQRGFAAPATVRWIATPASQDYAEASAF